MSGGGTLTAQELLTARYYDDHAEDWAGRHGTPDFWHAELGRFCAMLRPGAAILEIGPGSGQVAAELRARNSAREYLGVDVAAAMVRLAQDRVPGERFVLGSPYQLNLPDYMKFGGWLAICSLGVHAPPDRIGAALREIGRYLEPGAAGLIVIKPGEATERALDEQGRWFTYWRPADLTCQLETAGHMVTGSELRAGAGCGDRGWHCLWTRFGMRSAPRQQGPEDVPWGEHPQPCDCGDCP